MRRRHGPEIWGQRFGARDLGQGVGKSMVMKLIDVHSHWGTRRGYPLQTERELAQRRATWNSETRYHTEAEMAEHFRTNGVRAILDLGYAKYRPLEEMRALHDYGFETEAAHRDVILG